jgi:RimJ/RimL family protein N-acetyltransferase
MDSRSVSAVVEVGESDVAILRPFFEPGFDRYALTRPVFVVMLDGRVLAACTSSRESDVAAEAWVATEPDFRHQGLASLCTAAWAAHVTRASKTAFYSCDEANQGSVGVARRLGAKQWLSSVVIESA